MVWGLGKGWTSPPGRSGGWEGGGGYSHIIFFLLFLLLWEGRI